ncbi:general secretion pathway protein GspB [Marinobacter sp. M216]|uniref:General secretion pathway protein GspB n=1 Tax=Marinobacter albus TaxID=3030833 RepID=A0ABT7HBJ4_9GAMM|nr:MULTISPECIES: general secretion pathway protein GspB [unclassified Marinobacter]MBW7470009.1 general secretion pathway protein GspB [Marinobacter sp. F4218]MDK9557728.1 general secretion pathway protein GspB [Marinobacter sp. M216]
MSYILDALRKSETERRQGKIPDLGHQVQLIHRPKKKRLSAVGWIAIALVLNAAVLAAVFWPRLAPVTAESPPVSPAGDEVSASAQREASQQQSGRTVTDEIAAEPPMPADTEAPALPEAQPETALAESGGNTSDEAVRERPTIIVPSSRPDRDNPVLPDSMSAGRVPHLVELPLSFQKSVPDLTFNSHIYSSDPYASRVMINNNYLRRGDSFSGLRVERITEDGVILSKQGQRFRVGIVRDWVSPR